MISREFIYEFSNFDDISTRENDKKSREMGFSTREMGVWYKFERARVNFLTKNFKMRLHFLSFSRCLEKVAR